MEQTDHHLVVGHGAQVFARNLGFTIEDDLNTERSRAAWLEWKRRIDPEHWIDPSTRMEIGYQVGLDMVRDGWIEAVGRVAAEAQAMGRPVIASDHGGARETVRGGETGWLVRPGDAGQLAAALELALGMTPEERAVLREPRLGLVTEREQRLLGAQPAAGPGERHDLLGRHRVRAGLAGVPAKRAVAAVVAAEGREGDEDLLGEGHAPAPRPVARRLTAISTRPT